MFSLFIAFLGVGIIAPIIPVYATDMGATGITLGLMAAAFSVAQGVLHPVVGNLSDRHGRKRFLVAGLLVFAILGLSYTVANTVQWLIMARLLHGVGAAMIVPMVMAYVSDLSPKGQEGKYMGILNAALFAGIGCGPILGGIFRDTLGMFSAFYAMSALSAISLVFTIVFVPPGRSIAEINTSDGLFNPLKKVLRNTRVIGMLIPRIATAVLMIPTMTFLPVFMDRIMEATGVEIGIVIAARTIFNAGFQPVFGRMADRYNKLILIVLGCFIAGAGIFIVPFINNFIHLIVVFIIVGVGEAMVWPTLGAIATEEGRKYGQGSMMGVFNMAMSFGILIGSLTAGSFMDLLGLEYVFFIVAIFVILSGFFGIMLIRKGEKIGS